MRGAGAVAALLAVSLAACAADAPPAPVPQAAPAPRHPIQPPDTPWPEPAAARELPQPQTPTAGRVGTGPNQVRTRQPTVTRYQRPGDGPDLPSAGDRDLLRDRDSGSYRRPLPKPPTGTIDARPGTIRTTPGTIERPD